MLRTPTVTAKTTRDHIDYWAQLASTGAVPPDEYEEHPRGRVAFNEKKSKYMLLADGCILARKGLVAKIVSQMSLSIGRTKIDTDRHYCCYRCLGRRR
jgi:hypothetical protein